MEQERGDECALSSAAELDGPAVGSSCPCGFERYTAAADLAPLFAGLLPDDRCQCPHMGYVIEGKLTFTFADGHEGSQVVEFSPSGELQQTMEVVEKNMAAAGA